MNQLAGNVCRQRVDHVKRLRRDAAREGEQPAARLEDRAAGQGVDVDIVKGGEGEIAVEVGPERRGDKDSEAEDQQHARGKGFQGGEVR